MKQFPSEKYNIAWFKLSECVARGEKERALGVYKLLVHSIDDRAFAHQLEGDLLLAFEDEGATSKYVQAAHLYKKNQRFVEAAAVYEHLLVLEPDVEDHVVGLVSLYEILNFSEKLIDRLKEGVERFTNHNAPRKLNSFLTKLEEASPECHAQASQLLSGE